MLPNKKICIVSAYYYPHFGGVERYAENMAKQLVKNGFDVTVVTSAWGTDPGIEIREQITIYRIPIFSFLKDRYPIPLFFNKEYRRLIKTLKSQQFANFIINTRFYLLSMIGLWLAKKCAAKSIIIEHGTGHLKFGNTIIDRIGILYEHTLTWFLKKSFNAEYYGVSQSCVQWLKHFGINANGVIYNGVDVHSNVGVELHFRKDHGIPNDAVVFTFAGRLIEEKGIRFIVDLFIEFSEQYPQAYLFIAGTGPLYEETISKCSAHIIPLGKLQHKDIMCLLAETDVVLIPSDYPEGLPTLILEGGISACAIIATDRGGAKEVISDENLGIIINDPDKQLFWNAMEKMMHDKGYRVQCGKMLYQKVSSRFSWEHIVKEQLANILY